MSKKKILFFSSSRSDFGLLSNIILKVQKRLKNTSLIVSGSHLSKNFGYTIDEILKGNTKNIVKVPILSKTSDDLSVAKTFSKAVDSVAKHLQKIKPSLFVVLGDRYEVLAASISAMINRIPIAHIHGGEITEGAFDDFIRHSISKMSQIHFTAHKEYKRRLVQLGEKKNNIFNYGGLGAAKIKKIQLLSKREILNSLRLKQNKKYIVITYHPNTLDKKLTSIYFNYLLNSLKKFKGIEKIFTFPNFDNENETIISQIEKFKKKNSNVKIFKSLGSIKYLSLIKYSSGVIGNSSSGILEAPSFKIPVLNIGDRQKGRVLAKNIINSGNKEKDINKGLKKLFSRKFLNNIKNTKNPFYKKNTVENISNKLIKYKNKNLKKKFYDIYK